jgi:DNA processing protein
VTDDDEQAAWLRLIETPGIGSETARRLLAAFGSPQAVFDAPVLAWREVVGAADADALSSVPAGFDVLLERTRRWLAESSDDAPRRIVTLGDPDYSSMLLNTVDPPLVLYTLGRLELLAQPSIAIVGSRNPTAQGRDNARQFAAHLSRAGLTIVSGLALGIDGAAHEGGLAGPASTIAVVGTGLDRVYPARHRDLAHQIAQRGLVVTEYALGTPPLAQNFPRRNRIIAGLSRAALVVEAALQSGSLITARLAAESGRDVFAIPGSIHSPQSRGCHALIKQGAKLVESAADILDELNLARDGAPPAHETAADPLLHALGYDPVTLDALGARTGIGAAELSARLLELELAGQASRLPGGLYQRRVAS